MAHIDPYVNDVGGAYCPGCREYVVGAHACPGPRTYQPLNPNIRLGPLPHVLTEDDIRRIVREELQRASTHKDGEANG